ncbi:MAG: HAMP domain-containing histidine kinase, partial [Oligoflexales bacterium]|nr:HAMP domain-containing histidine kinase [Oligoflexales bacterium]
MKISSIEKKLSFSNLLNSEFNKVFISIMLIGMAAITALDFSYSFKREIFKLDNDLQSFENSQFKRLQYFDYTQMNEDVHSFIINRPLNGIIVLDRFGVNIASRNIFPFNFRHNLKENHKYFSFNERNILYIIVKPLLTKDGQYLGTIVVNVNILELFLPLIIRSLLLMFTLFLIFISLKIVLSNVTRSIIKPLSDFTDRLSKLENNSDIIEVYHDKNIIITELAQLQKNFNELQRRSSAAESLRNENIKLNSIAQTTQMLAHDVRKPFSILKIGLDMFKDVTNMSELESTLKTFAPEVEKAMTSVNGMINDVMEIGRNSAPHQEIVSVESVIEATLSELCRIYQDANIALDYSFDHKHMLYVDPLKVGRIFSNILSNAFQAIKFKGNVWIKTKEENGMMKICIGNSGSFINEEDIQHLFSAFFSKNKKGGTGLGLAIAHKVVTNHGGKIWCESSEKKNSVDFYFTLPIDLRAITIFNGLAFNYFQG